MNLRLPKIELKFWNPLWQAQIRLGSFIDIHANLLMFILGISILATGLVDFASAANTNQINTTKIKCASVILLSLVEGDFGALIMVIAGISTIIASAFGAFRSAQALLVVACASFILRSLVDIWFSSTITNTDTPGACQQQLGGGNGGIGGNPGDSH